MRSDFLRALNDGLNGLGWGVYQTDHEDANFQYEVNFTYADALDNRRSPYVLSDDGRPACPAGGCDRDLHGQTILDPHRLRRAHALSSGRRIQRSQSVSRTSPTLAAWDSRRWPITSSAACSTMPRPCARSHRRRSTATSDSRWARLSPARVRAIPGRRPSSPMATITGPRCSAFPSRACRGSLDLERVQSLSRHGRLPRRRPGRHRARGSIPASPTWATSIPPTSKPWPAAASGRSPKVSPKRWPISRTTRVIKGSLGPIADELIRLKRDEWREYHAQVESWEINRYLTAL